MGYIFELEHHQQMILYTEGNEIVGIAAGRRGGEFLLRTGYLSNLSAVQYQDTSLAFTGTSHYSVGDGESK